MTRVLTPDHLDGLAKRFAADPVRRLAQNAVTTTSIRAVALDRAVVMASDHSVSHRIDDWKVTDQKRSGRCWLFAGTNLLRSRTATSLGVEQFEFSQSHLLFWDKLEKANFWLEAVLATADRDLDDRSVAHLLANPAEDGGQWNMFVALVAKHGLVPKAAMPETQSSSDTAPMNRALAYALRQGARDVRAQVAAGDPPEALQTAKHEVLAAVHRILSVHLGTPPDTVQWQWTDRDKAFHREERSTPVEFARRHVSLPLDDYVCVVHDPRPTSPEGRLFTVEHLGNVVGAPPVTYLNVGIDLVRELAAASLVDGEPVWFGCDTDRMSNAELGLWDAALYDYDGVYGTSSTMTKADRLQHHESLMTHAMLFTGVDLVDGSPRRWRVENSWGPSKADQGFYTMNDNWFAEHVFEIAVHRDRLPAHLRSVLDDEPIVLPAWDPMGALARA